MLLLLVAAVGACAPSQRYTQMEPVGATVTPLPNLFINTPPDARYVVVGSVLIQHRAFMVAPFDSRQYIDELIERARQQGCDGVFWKAQHLIIDGVPDADDNGTLIRLNEDRALQWYGIRARCVHLVQPTPAPTRTPTPTPTASSPT